MAILKRLRGWEGLLLVILIAIVTMNVLRSPYYLGIGNIVNLFQLSIEKVVLALIMTLIIINGEIDLSVASVMGLAACILAWLFSIGVPFPVAILAALLCGLAAGLFLLEMLARFMEDAQAMARAVRWGDPSYIEESIKRGRKIRRSLIELKQA